MALSDEELPYRSPVAVEEAEPVSIQDEQDYSTLRSVHSEFNQAMTDLYRNFNAFDLADNAPHLRVQVLARQEAYKILEPLQAKLKSAIEDVKVKYEGQ